MARLRCEVLEREGRLVRHVRDENGRILRLYAESPPASAWWAGTIEGTGHWAESAALPDAALPDPLEVVWLDTPALDEVGVPVGPDRGDALGLFDSPTTASTGEHTEGPNPGAEGDDREAGGQRRTAVLAWIAAQAAHTPPPAEGGVPCEPLKRLIADEPLDPLPALDGLPKPRASALPGVAPLIGAAPRAPEREDTATQIEGFAAMLDRRASAAEPDDHTAVGPTPTVRPPPSPLLLLLVALAAAAAAWLLQAAF